MQSKYRETQPKFTRSTDLAKVAWEEMAQFTNVDWTADALKKKNKIKGNKHAQNLKKQASQMRNCLDLSKEYLLAAKTVSMATRPVLAYYGVMHLALSQMLWGGNGAYSLDQLRKTDRHHGLIFTNSKTNNDPWIDQADSLKAEVALHNDQPRGTFPRWHELSRHLGVLGRTTKSQEGVQAQSFGSILLNHDLPPKSLASSELTLLECMKMMPSMIDFLWDRGIASNLIRGSVEKNEVTSPDPMDIMTTVVQPTLRNTNKFQERFRCKLPNCDAFDFFPQPSGFVLKVSSSWMNPQEMEYPNAYTLNHDVLYFLDTDLDINEFGICYLALFILGNYARYYPDLWFSDINERTHLFQAIEKLVDDCIDRTPVLSFAALTDRLILSDTR